MITCILLKVLLLPSPPPPARWDDRIFYRVICQQFHRVQRRCDCRYNIKPH